MSMMLGHVSVFLLVALLHRSLFLSEPSVLCSETALAALGQANVQLLVVPAAQPPYRPSDPRWRSGDALRNSAGPTVSLPDWTSSRPDNTLPPASQALHSWLAGKLPRSR